MTSIKIARAWACDNYAINTAAFVFEVKDCMQEATNSFPTAILNVIQKSCAVRSHQELFNWLQADIQPFIPHDIFIAAWGEFSSGLIALDIVSPVPGVRTTEVNTDQLFPVLLELFDHWIKNDYEPFGSQVNDKLFRFSSTAGNDAFAYMHSAVVHGIRDERGWDDCLYVALSGDTRVPPLATQSIGLLMPYIDAAFRQVDHLPMQRSNNVGSRLPESGAEPETSGTSSRPSGDSCSILSKREQEIMRWVSIGKTNLEIGLILGISPSTVRNHLQHIFRKLDVFNRAQAVYQIERMEVSQHGP